MENDVFALKTMANLDNGTACRLFNINVRTWQRWKHEKQVPHPAALKLLRVWAGEMVWPGWDKFHVQGGLIYAPGSGNGLTPPDISNYAINLQRLALAERHNRAKAQYLLDF